MWYYTIVFIFVYCRIFLCIDSSFCVLGTINNFEAAKFTLFMDLNFSQILYMFRFESF